MKVKRIITCIRDLNDKSTIAYVMGMLLFFISCGNGPDRRSNAVEQKPIPVPSAAEDLGMYEISLPYNDSLIEDENSFIFFKSVRFDTSFILQIRNMGSKIRGVYYRATPADWFLKSKIDTANEMSCFNGFGFKLEEKEWRLITGKFNSFQFDTTSMENYLGCCDQTYYFSSHNSKKGFNKNRNNEIFLKGLEKFLKDTILIKYKILMER